MKRKPTKAQIAADEAQIKRLADTARREAERIAAENDRIARQQREAEQLANQKKPKKKGWFS